MPGEIELSEMARNAVAAITASRAGDFDALAAIIEETDTKELIVSICGLLEGLFEAVCKATPGIEPDDFYKELGMAVSR